MSIQKPSEAEEEYFARLEADQQRRLADARRARIALEEQARLRLVHWMRCPYQFSGLDQGK